MNKDYSKRMSEAEERLTKIENSVKDFFRKDSPNIRETKGKENILCKQCEKRFPAKVYRDEKGIRYVGCFCGKCSKKYVLYEMMISKSEFQDCE